MLIHIRSLEANAWKEIGQAITYFAIRGTSWVENK